MRAGEGASNKWMWVHESEPKCFAQAVAEDFERLGSAGCADGEGGAGVDLGLVGGAIAGDKVELIGGGEISISARKLSARMSASRSPVRTLRRRTSAASSLAPDV
jgi:hypothetical protein